MPQLSEVKNGSEIGKTNRGGRYIWHACVDCGKERWVDFRHNVPQNLRCLSCSCRRHSWKGGYFTDGRGYVRVWLQSDDPFRPMASKRGYIFEHRLVMAQYLKRCLRTEEIVHHKDGIRNHNEYSNLELTSKGSHTIEHNAGYRDGYRKGYEDGKREVLSLYQDDKVVGRSGSRCEKNNL